jgi:hypothetical protein
MSRRTVAVGWRSGTGERTGKERRSRRGESERARGVVMVACGSFWAWWVQVCVLSEEGTGDEGMNPLVEAGIEMAPGCAIVTYCSRM